VAGIRTGPAGSPGGRCVRPVAAPQREPRGRQDCTEREEAQVPPRRVGHVVADVVDAEDVVVDDPFDEVEDSPAGEEQSQEAAP
jgi:hypothetical protein